jgi:hypothetical protein
MLHEGENTLPECWFSPLSSLCFQDESTRYIWHDFRQISVNNLFVGGQQQHLVRGHSGNTVPLDWCDDPSQDGPRGCINGRSAQVGQKHERDPPQHGSCKQLTFHLPTDDQNGSGLPSRPVQGWLRNVFGVNRQASHQAGLAKQFSGRTPNISDSIVEACCLTISVRKALDRLASLVRMLEHALAIVYSQLCV